MTAKPLKKAAPEEVYASLVWLMQDAARYQDSRPLVMAYRASLIRIGNQVDRQRRS